MKKIAIIIVIFIVMSQFLSQAQPPAPGFYVTNSNIDKFVGRVSKFGYGKSIRI